MTYLLHTTWIACMMLTVGELDRLLGHLFSRSRRGQIWANPPDVHWLATTFSSFCIPGLGQFLNGQPIKALFLLTWPILTILRSPIPPPWQLWMVKSLWLIVPAWILSVLDALIVSLIRSRRRKRQAAALPPDDRNAAIAQFLDRKRPGKS